jgi:hypothetical protein
MALSDNIRRYLLPGRDFAKSLGVDLFTSLLSTLLLHQRLLNESFLDSSKTSKYRFYSLEN